MGLKNRANQRIILLFVPQDYKKPDASGLGKICFVAELELYMTIHYHTSYITINDHNYMFLYMTIHDHTLYMNK